MIETRGDEPLKELLRSLGGWPVLDATWDVFSFDWLQLVIKLRILNNRVLINQWVSADDRNSSANIIHVSQCFISCNSGYFGLFRLVLDSINSCGNRPHKTIAVERKNSHI